MLARALGDGDTISMTTITIALPEERVLQLEELAQQAGVAPEELLRASVDEWLSRNDLRFAQAADYVLSRNEELYRRLA